MDHRKVFKFTTRRINVRDLNGKEDEDVSRERTTILAPVGSGRLTVEEQGNTGLDVQT